MGRMCRCGGQDGRAHGDAIMPVRRISRSGSKRPGDIAPMKRLARRFWLLPVIAMIAVLSQVPAEGDAVAASDNWFCVAANDAEHGEGHYDNVLEGWYVQAPDGQHVSWGAGTSCTTVHTPASPD